MKRNYGVEKRKIEVAQEFRAQDYDVYTSAPGFPEPYEIEGVVPDLIARKGDETVIVVVRTEDSIRNSDTVVQLSTYARRTPRTRFDLVMADPKSLEGEFPAHPPTTSDVLPGGLLVFVSHASEDAWVAQRIAEQIQACGARTFLDEADLEVGDNFEERILGELREADEFLILLTPRSLSSPFVWAEVGVAWANDIPIIGVLHGVTPEGLPGEAGLPMFLRQRHLFYLNHFEDYLSELRVRVSSVN